MGDGDKTHEHATIAEAMRCLVPDGGSFIRAFEAGASRSLNEAEYKEFLAALSQHVPEIASCDIPYKTNQAELGGPIENREGGNPVLKHIYFLSSYRVRPKARKSRIYRLATRILLSYSTNE
jgi:hypothetical protein